MRALAILAALLFAAGCAEQADTRSASDPAPTPGTPSTTTPEPTPSPSPTPPTPSPTPKPTPSPTPMTPTPPPEPGPNEVFVRGFAFVPASLTVFAGESVRWVSFDDVSHTLSADDGSFDETLGPSGESSRTFGTPGNFTYRCKLHPSMTGSVEVKGDDVVVLPPPTPTPTPSPPAPVSIAITGFTFQGPHTIPVGTTVTWTNQDGAPHTATADGGAFHTGTLSQGQSASHTFNAAGTFAYHCAVHPSMTATMTVTA